MRYPFLYRSKKENGWLDWEDRAAEVEGENEAAWLLLSVYADGEATPEEAEVVEAMLREDAVYAQAFALMQQTTHALHLAPELDPPAHLQSAILEATTRRETPVQRWVSGWQRFRQTLAPRALRYAVPAGALGVTLTALALYPRLSQIPTTVLPEAEPQPGKIARKDSSANGQSQPGETTGTSAATLNGTLSKKNGGPSPTQTTTLAQKEEPRRPIEFAKLQTPASESKRSDRGRSEKATPLPVLRGNRKTQLPKTPMGAPGHLEPISIADSYPVLPMMDDINQRGRRQMMAEGAMSTSTGDGDNALDRDTSERIAVVTSREDSPAVRETPRARTAALQEEPSVNGFRRVRVKLPSIPPDARRLMTVSDIKRIREGATAMQNDWDNSRSLQDQKTATVISGRF